MPVLDLALASVNVIIPQEAFGYIQDPFPASESSWHAWPYLYY